VPVQQAAVLKMHAEQKPLLQNSEHRAAWEITQKTSPEYLHSQLL